MDRYTLGTIVHFALFGSLLSVVEITPTEITFASIHPVDGHYTGASYHTCPIATINLWASKYQPLSY